MYAPHAALKDGCGKSRRITPRKRACGCGSAFAMAPPPRLRRSPQAWQGNPPATSPSSTPETTLSASSLPVALSTRSRPHLSRPPASRSTLPAVSLHRRGHCLPPLGHHGRLYHHSPAPARVLVSTPCHRPHAARIGQPELRCLEHIFRRAVPGVARNAEGTICFSDPQHIEVWRLPAAPPPSRGRLQFRFISADYPTAGQKRRLTTPIASRDVILPSQDDSA